MTKEHSDDARAGEECPAAEPQPEGNNEGTHRQSKSRSLRSAWEERKRSIPDLHIDAIIAEAKAESESDPNNVDHIRLESVRPAKSSQSSKKKKHRHSLKARRPGLYRLLCTLLVIVLVIAGVAVAAFLWTSLQINRGRGQMLVHYDDTAFSLPADDERIVSEDGGQTLTYNGHTYALNRNITTVLVLGIDRKEMEEFEAVSVVGSGGQADVIILMAEDTTTGETKLLNIPRDTYAEFMTYTVGGLPAGYTKSQICLAYAYGDGMQSSCQNMSSAVSNLLYGMPISRTVAIDMAGVRIANDAIGGVSLESMIDMTLTNGKTVSKGDRITLHGEDCNSYLISREHDIEGSGTRSERHKQYVRAFGSQLRSKARSDLSVITTLYQQVRPYIVTDLEIGDVLFLAKTYLDYGIDFSFMDLKGETEWLDNPWGYKVSTLYLDEDHLFESILDLYYTQTD